jgi:hypothetical protein
MDIRASRLLTTLRTLTPQGRALVAGCCSAVLIFVAGVSLRDRRPPPRPQPPPQSAPPPSPKPVALAPLAAGVRKEPDSFRRNTYMPKKRESAASGSIDLSTFSAGRDLTYIDDPRVWWESDRDRGDTECDHTIHYCVERPLRRLINLVTEAGGKLKIQDCFRGEGIHNPRSLHKEGRAIDVTCDELGLERLAKLCWAAGFDWVYHETPSSGGSHVHASVRRKHKDTPEAYRSGP